MLEKLLPSIFQKKTRSNLNQENQQQRSLSKDSKEGVSLESDFDLISESQKLYIAPKFAIEITLVIRKFIVAVSVAFGVLLILNFTVSFMIQYQKGWQNRLVEKVDSYSEIEERAKSISDKTVAYKRFLNDRVVMYDKTAYAIDNIGTEITLTTLQVSPETFSLSVSSKNAVEITNLIIRYLDKGLVSEIVLESAAFDRSKSEYKVMLRGTFK